MSRAWTCGRFGVAALVLAVALGACSSGSSSANDSTSTTNAIDQLTEGIVESNAANRGPVAQDDSAQSALRNALTAAKTFYTDSETYAGITTRNLEMSEPSIRFTTGPSDRSVSLAVGDDGQTIAFAAKSDHDCFWIRNSITAWETTYGSGTPCTGKAALGAAKTSW